jgi:hypothetical protein
MKQPKTKVLFRMIRGSYPGAEEEPMAVFPEIEGSPGYVSSYVHHGQHGDANVSHVIRVSRPAKPSEYASLKRELEGVPYHYDLKVIKRVSRSRRTRHGASR